MTVTLRPHQEVHADALERILRTRAAALDASDTGTGKTYTALAVAKRLHIARPFVVCPKSVAATWRSVGAQMGLDVTAVGYEKARGGSKGGRHASDYGEEVPYGKGSFWRWHEPGQFIIFDEVHRCGAQTSLQSKLLIAARRQFHKLLLLSATAADDPTRMKALGYALDLFDMKDYRWWLLRTGVKPGQWGGFVFSGTPAQRNAVMQRLHGELFPARGARMRKAEIPGFPQTSIEPCMLPDEQGEADKLCDELLKLYNDRLLQAAAAAALAEEEHAPHAHLERMLRVRQSLEALKVPHLVELATDHAHTSRVVVFAHFRDTLEALQQKLEKVFDVVPIIDGRNTAEQRASIQAEFQANRIPVLLCNAEAGGIALSLHDPTGQVERTALISPGWSARQFKQMLGRVHRDGGAFSQQRLVGFADTLEETIVRTLAERCDRIDLLNDGLLHGVI